MFVVAKTICFVKHICRHAHAHMHIHTHTCTHCTIYSLALACWAGGNLHAMCHTTHSKTRLHLPVFRQLD